MSQRERSWHPLVAARRVLSQFAAIGPARFRSGGARGPGLRCADGIGRRAYVERNAWIRVSLSLVRIGVAAAPARGGDRR
jgi:hypothetical protein